VSLKVEVARRTKEKGQHKKLRMERIKEIKTKPIFVVSVLASLKEVQWRFLPNDLSLKKSNTDEKVLNIRTNLCKKH